MKHFIFTSFLLLAHPSWAVIKVVTTIPDLAEVVREVGGAEVDVTSLLDGSEDPHFADAVPSYIQKVNRAQVVCSVGLELELGWLPKVLSKSGNAQVQPGGKGFCEAGKTVKALEVPTAPVDRSMGDIHRLGNPHFYLSPTQLGLAGETVASVLSDVEPSKKEYFSAQLKQFQAKMRKLTERVSEMLKPFKETYKDRGQMIEYHKEFVYFFDEYGLKSFGSIEDKPGVEPSGARLAHLAKDAEQKSFVLGLASKTAPEKHLNRFTELTKVPVIRVPALVQTNKDPKSIEALQLLIAQSILDALGKK